MPKSSTESDWPNFPVERTEREEPSCPYARTLTPAPTYARPGEAIENALPIYLNQDTFDTCKGAYPYLVPELRRRDDVPRRVASLHWRVIDNATPFAVRGKGQAVQVTPIPVLHGGQYVCLGFAFGQGRCARRRVQPLFPSQDWH